MKQKIHTIAKQAPLGIRQTLHTDMGNGPEHFIHDKRVDVE